MTDNSQETEATLRAALTAARMIRDACIRIATERAAHHASMTALSGVKHGEVASWVQLELDAMREDVARWHARASILNDEIRRISLELKSAKQ